MALSASPLHDMPDTSSFPGNDKSGSNQLAAVQAAVVRWGSIRNILQCLIAMQVLIIVFIGFSVSELPDGNSPLIQREDVRHLSSVDARKTPAPIISFMKEVDDGKVDVSSAPLVSFAKEVDDEQADGVHVLKTQESHKPVKMEEVTVSATNADPLHVTGAYFADFRMQRAQPSFRNAALPGNDKWVKRETFLSRQQQQQGTANHSLKSCSYYEHGRILVHPECQPAADGQYPAVVAYNSLEGIERTWCGQVMPPRGFRRMERGCSDSVKIFPHDSPPLSGAGMPPIKFIRTSDMLGEQQMLESCTINCKVTTKRCEHVTRSASAGQEETIDCFPKESDWTIGDTNWNFKIYLNAPEVKFNRKAYRNFSFYASQSLKSDVPHSTFRWDRDGGTPTPALDFGFVDKSVSFLDDTPCRGHNDSAIWVQTFKEKTKLASYGNCIPTTPIPPGFSLQNEADRNTLLQKHMFNFVADSTETNEFACGAVWDAIYAGVIPVYYGPNNISQYVPPHSIIIASEIGTKERTADLIMEIAMNKTLWESYHAWRKNPFPSHLKQKLELIPTEPFLCRICKWAYAKRYGLAWNPRTQSIQMPTIARDYVYQSADGFVLQPFRESWIFSSPSSAPYVAVAAASTKCTESAGLTQVFQSDGLFSVTRTMSQHDSIVDFIIPEVKSKHGQVVLRLEVPIQNWEGSHFRHVHQRIASDHVAMYSSVAIQDRSSRMIVLANWPTELRSPAKGIVDVVVQGPDEESLLTNEIRRIRILLEDISSFPDVKTEYAVTPFAKPLMQDFLDPLELYIVVP